MAKTNPIKQGEIFTRLTVISYSSRNKAYWCVCDCGKIVKARSYALRSGKSKSCGCYIKDKMSEIHTKPNFIGPKNELYKNYKQAAIRRNKDFFITKVEFFELITQPCYHCGIKDSMKSSRNPKFKYNGVDRLDNNLGYIFDNCVPCCSTCNYAKHELTLEQFQAWVDNLVDFQLRKSNN